MARVTRHTFPWVALAPVADAANVIARRISQEDVSTFISALRVPLQSSACSRQRLEIGIIIHSDQQIRNPLDFVCLSLMNRRERYAGLQDNYGRAPQRTGLRRAERLESLAHCLLFGSLLRVSVKVVSPASPVEYFG